MIISTANAIISGTDDDYITARMSLLFDNLKNASEEDKQEFIRLAEINNRVTKGEERSIKRKIKKSKKEIVFNIVNKTY